MDGVPGALQAWPVLAGRRTPVLKPRSLSDLITLPAASARGHPRDEGYVIKVNYFPPWIEGLRRRCSEEVVVRRGGL